MLRDTLYSMLKGQEAGGSETTANLLDQYKDDLRERVLAEGKEVSKLLETPPQVILVHVYGAEKDETGKWIPNVEGHYGIRSALEFVSATKERHPGYSPIILTAGGNPYNQEGNNIARVYRDAIEKEVQQGGLSGVIVTDEQEFVEAGNASRLASDTRGELTFLNKYLEQNKVTTALSVGRIEHGERIERLLTANGIQAQFVSTEGVLAYFHPQAVERFVQMFSEIIESEHNFSEAEKKKLMIMLVDRKGTLIEFLATVAGPLKNSLYSVLKQERL